MNTATELRGSVTVINLNNAREHASNILQRYHLGDLPIDPVALAKRMRIQIKPSRFKKDWISGGIHKEGNETTIYVKSTDSLSRQRFTVAHEIGHYIMHMDEIGKDGLLEKIDMFRDPNDNSLKELEANEFAASLLMPEGKVRQYWGIYGSTEVLADMFCVSLSAMSYRLYKLGLKSEW